MTDDQRDYIHKIRAGEQPQGEPRLEPCPFCNVTLEINEARWASHPSNRCFMSGHQFLAGRITTGLWNTRARPVPRALTENQCSGGIEGWRMLEVGEVIREGDEFRCSYDGEDRATAPWESVDSDFGVVGVPLFQENAGHFRRLVAPAPRGLPWRAGQQCENQRDKGDLHYPLFWDDCGCAAHVFKKEDAEFIILAVNNHERLKRELADAQRERDVLAQWKKEALTVESWWQKIDAFVRKHPDGVLGAHVSETALRFMQERDAAQRERDEAQARYEAALRQKNPTAERPALISELEAQIVAAQDERDKARATSSQALARQAELMQQLADIHAITNLPGTAEDRVAAIAERTRPTPLHG